MTFLCMFCEVPKFRLLCPYTGVYLLNKPLYNDDARGFFLLLAFTWGGGGNTKLSFLSLIIFCFSILYVDLAGSFYTSHSR